MKTIHALCIIIAATVLSSCVTTETTVTSPDGTITHTKTTTPAAGSMEVAGTAVTAAGQILADK